MLAQAAVPEFAVESRRERVFQQAFQSGWCAPPCWQPVQAVATNDRLGVKSALFAQFVREGPARLQSPTRPRASAGESRSPKAAVAGALPGDGLTGAHGHRRMRGSAGIDGADLEPNWATCERLQRKCQCLPKPETATDVCKVRGLPPPLPCHSANAHRRLPAISNPRRGRISHATKAMRGKIGSLDFQRMRGPARRWPTWPAGTAAAWHRAISQSAKT